MALKVAVWGRKGTRKVLRVLVGGLGFLFGLLIKLLSVHLIKKNKTKKNWGFHDEIHDLAQVTWGSSESRSCERWSVTVGAERCLVACTIGGSLFEALQPPFVTASSLTGQG